MKLIKVALLNLSVLFSYCLGYQGIYAASSETLKKLKGGHL